MTTRPLLTVRTIFPAIRSGHSHLAPRVSNQTSQQLESRRRVASRPLGITVSVRQSWNACSCRGLLSTALFCFSDIALMWRDTSALEFYLGPARKPAFIQMITTSGGTTKISNNRVKADVHGAPNHPVSRLR